MYKQCSCLYRYSAYIFNIGTYPDPYSSIDATYNCFEYSSTNQFKIKAGSQNDASLALRQLRCDKILKTDWSNATQLTQR